MLTLEQLIKERNRHQRLKEAYTLIINELKEKEPEQEQKKIKKTISRKSHTFSTRRVEKRTGGKQRIVSVKIPWSKEEDEILMDCLNKGQEVDILLKRLPNRNMKGIHMRMYNNDKELWALTPSSWRKELSDLTYGRKNDTAISQAA